MAPWLGLTSSREGSSPLYSPLSPSSRPIRSSASRKL
ncbi:hypothetical protein HaLaN_31760, partial [Haematococcus lacustris]